MKKEEIKIGNCYNLEFNSSSRWIIYVTGFAKEGAQIKGWFMQIGYLGGKWKEQILGDVNSISDVKLATIERIEELIQHLKANGDIVYIPLPDVSYLIY